MSDRVAPSGHVPRQLDFAGFAQEFLRRNPAYRSEHARLVRRGRGDAAIAAKEAMARRWGLGFSLRA